MSKANTHKPPRCFSSSSKPSPGETLIPEKVLNVFDRPTSASAQVPKFSPPEYGRVEAAAAQRTGNTTASASNLRSAPAFVSSYSRRTSKSAWMLASMTCSASSVSSSLDMPDVPMVKDSAVPMVKDSAEREAAFDVACSRPSSVQAVQAVRVAGPSQQSY